MSFKETLYAARSQPSVEIFFGRPSDSGQLSTLNTLSSPMLLRCKSDSHTYHILLQWEIELAHSDLHVIVLV